MRRFSPLMFLLILSWGRTPLAEPLGFRIGVADSMLKVPRERNRLEGIPIEWGGKIKVELTRGEAEGIQIVILAPEAHALRQLNLVLNPPSHVSLRGVRFPIEGISLWRVGYVEVYNLWEPHESLGWHPDPLLPLEGSFDIEAGNVQPIWLSIEAPEKVPAGLYRGEVTVLFQGKELARVPLEVLVWDFSLPREQHFTLTIPVWGGQMESMYPGSMDRRRWLAYLDFLLKHRIAPFPLDDEEMRFCYERGQRYFCLHCFPADHVPEDSERTMTQLALRWKGFPWSARAIPFVLLGDEAPPEWYPYIKEQGRIVRQAFPKARRMFTLSPDNTTKGFEYAFKELKGAGDTVILGVYPSLIHDLTHKARSAGFDVWWYYVASHYYIPTEGVEVRSVFWRHWKYKVPGQLHWGMTYWGEENIRGREGKKWPDIPWDTRACRSGDGYLVYPAPGGGKVFPSIRLELIRDGIEDYEYFHLLWELTEELKALEDGERIAGRISQNEKLLRMDGNLVKSYTEYSRSPRDYRLYRRRLADAILATKSFLKISILDTGTKNDECLP